jgi:mRNA interferase MazF
MPSTINYQSGDADVLLARVTTQPQTTPYELAPGWFAGPSFVRLHKLATLSKARIQRRLGTLEAADRGQVSKALKQLIVAW